MKQHIRQRFLVGLLVFTALISVVPSRVSAVAGSVYFERNGGQVINGTEFTVEVRGNVPRPTTWPFYGGGTTMIVSYDANKLQLVSRDDTGGVFAGGNKSWNTATAGTVRYVSTVPFNAPAVNNQKIISITFKAINVGSAPLSFGSGISVHDGPTTGTPAAFTVIAPTCPAGQVGTPPNCTTPPPPAPAPNPAPAATPAATPRPAASPQPAVATPAPVTEELPVPVAESDGGLKIENVRLTATRQRNSISWTLNKDEASPVVTYGLTKNSQKSEAKIVKSEDGIYTADFSSLKLGTLYYFSIKASTPDNLQGATYSGTLTTRGYPVQLTIQQKGVLSPGAKVVIGTRTFNANKNAIITTELSDGKFDASITPSGTGQALSASFTVAKKTIPASGNPELQSFVLDPGLQEGGSASNSSIMPYIIGGLLLLLLIIGSIIGFLLYRKKQQESHQNTVDQDMLITNYGPAIDNYSVNTPTPNLGNAAADASLDTPFANTYATSDTTNSQYAAASNEQPPYSDSSLSQPLDATSLPLPPNDPSYQNSQSYSDSPIDDEQDMYAENAQAVELAQIESEEAFDPNEPSAVYDEATGELDIIHHHDHKNITAINESVSTQPQDTAISPSTTSDLQPHSGEAYTSSDTTAGAYQAELYPAQDPYTEQQETSTDPSTGPQITAVR